MDSTGLFLFSGSPLTLCFSRRGVGPISVNADVFAAEPEWRRHGRFLSALFDNDVSKVRDLLSGQEGPPVDPDIRIRVAGESKPALCVAVERDLLEISQLLVKRGCSVNLCDPRGVPAVHTAVERQHVKLLALLLASGANVRSLDPHGCTPLHLAAAVYGDRSLEMAQLLLAAGSPLDQRDSQGLTPLSLACLVGHRALVSFLLSLGASTGLVDCSGDTPLHYACLCDQKDPEIVRMLLKAKAPVNLKNKIGLTPLACAVVSGADANIISILVHQGSDVHTRFGHLQQTLLHSATERSFKRDGEAAKMLVRFGCAPFTVDRSGCSAMDVALTRNWSLALWFLRTNPEVGQRRWRVAVTAATAMSADPSCSGREALLAEALSVPRLTQLCRFTFRKKYARDADAVIRSLPLPPRVARFLLLSDTL